MENKLEDNIREYVHGCLGAFTGSSKDLKECIEILLGHKASNSAPKILSQLEHIRILLEHPGSVFPELPEDSTSQTQTFIKALLEAEHASLSKDGYLSFNQEADTSTMFQSVFTSLNYLNLDGREHEEGNDENHSPDSYFQ